MLRSLFILMLVALMAAVGLYYENQTGLDVGINGSLVAATAVRKAPVPERAVDTGCTSRNLQAPDYSEKGSENRPAAGICDNSMDVASNNPPKH